MDTNDGNWRERALVWFGACLLWSALLATPSPCEPFHDLSFVREHLEFRVDARDGDSFTPSSDVLDMTGLYAFRNLSEQPISQRILYPVPVDEHMGTFEWIEAHWAGTDERVDPIQRDSAAVVLMLEFAPREERLLAIHYRQAMHGDRFTYLLTTARGWGRPIEEAEFILRLPVGLRADSCSFKPDRCQDDADGTLCFWQRRDFTPTQEFVVWFSRAVP